MNFVIEYNIHQYDDAVPLVPAPLSLSFTIDLKHPCYDTSIIIDPAILSSPTITYSLYHTAYTETFDFTYVSFSPTTHACPEPTIAFVEVSDFTDEDEDWF